MWVAAGVSSERIGKRVLAAMALGWLGVLLVAQPGGSMALDWQPVLIAVAALAMFPVSPLPAPSGQHSVGMRDFMLTDSSRTGVLNAATDEPRRLLVRVWYPAAPVPGAQPRQYFSDADLASSRLRELPRWRWWSRPPVPAQSPRSACPCPLPLGQRPPARRQRSGPWQWRP